MCYDVIIHKNDGEEILCETQGELADEMSKGLYFHSPEYCHDWTDSELVEEWGFEPEVCLCPVDLKNTAEINGYQYSEYDENGEWDAFCRHFYEEGYESKKAKALRKQAGTLEIGRQITLDEIEEISDDR
jgi:hypothetical protein